MKSRYLLWIFSPLLLLQCGMCGIDGEFCSVHHTGGNRALNEILHNSGGEDRRQDVDHTHLLLWILFPALREKQSCIFHWTCLIWAFSFTLLANSCMKGCFIGSNAEIIKHISTAIVLSVFKNIFHVTASSCNLKWKTIFSCCLLNVRGFHSLGKMNAIVLCYIAWL